MQPPRPATFVGRFALATLLLAALAPAATAKERYFVIVFGSQREYRETQYTHSWAVFVRADGACLNEAQLDWFTISWMPEKLVIEPRKREPEPGANLDLQTTLDWCLSHEMKIAMWGPYEITPDLWNKAGGRRSQMESGAIQYRALDSGRKPDSRSNCIHALSTPSVTGRRGTRVTSLSWGEPASRLIAMEMRHEMIDPAKNYPEIADRLGLREWPIDKREVGRLPATLPRIRSLIR